MTTPRVFNLRARSRFRPRPEDDCVYVGRPTKWGNPFDSALDRAWNVSRYEHWLRSQPELVAEARRELRGRNLSCYCHPLACHAHVLLRVANETNPWEPT